MQLSKQLKLTETQVCAVPPSCPEAWENLIFSLDQDLVSKQTDEVETEIHERPGAGGPAVLLHPGYPRPPAYVHRRPSVVRSETGITLTVLTIDDILGCSVLTALGFLYRQQQQQEDSPAL